MKRMTCESQKSQIPPPRRIQFEFSKAESTTWHELGPHVSHFYNALSLTLPAGERFLIDVLQDYKKDIAGSLLNEQVQGFIGQEAMHSRIHLQYNETLQSAGLPARKIDRLCKMFSKLRRKFTPLSTQLAVAVVFEQYTAMVSNFFLYRLGDINNDYVKLWTWHALEEIEHKGVLFDVWRSIVKPGFREYLLRIGAMLSVTVVSAITLFILNIWLIAADPGARWNITGFFRLIKYIWGPRGLFIKIMPEWLRFFQPGFHPWKMDNSKLLCLLDKWEEEKVVTRIKMQHGQQQDKK